MPITPNTRPETTVRKDGVVTTVHRSNGVEGRAGVPKKIRVLPPTPAKDDLLRIQQLAEGNGGVVVYEDDATPEGYEVAYAKVLGYYTAYLLEDSNNTKRIVGRIEEQNGAHIAYSGGSIRGGHYISSAPGSGHKELFATIVDRLGKGEESKEERRARLAREEHGDYFAPRGKVPAKTKNRPSPKDIDNWFVSSAMSSKFVTTEEGSTDYAGVKHFTVIRVTPKDRDTTYFFGERAHDEARNFARDEETRILNDEWEPRKYS